MPHAYRKIERLINSTEKGNRFPSFEWLMYMISFAYHGLSVTRSALYEKNIFKPKKLPCPVISIGNLTMGGTGKTPMTIYLTRLLLGMGYKPAVLTRGYKGNLEHKGGIVSDGKRILCTPEDAGDEPYMLASIVGVPVIVGKNRFLSGLKAINKFSCDALILDDGFQHRQLHRDVDILLMDTKAPLGNGFILPRGPLREPLSAAERGSAIVFTRSDSNKISQLKHIIQRFRNKPVFYCSHEPFTLEMVPDENKPTVKDTVFLFTGIADHSSVKNSCKKLGLMTIGHFKYPDHHPYSSSDIKTIVDEFKKSGAGLVATTHKDYIKIKDRFPSEHPLLVIDVKIKFVDKDKSIFENWIKEKVGMAASNETG